jgi:hypothetical protein
MGRTYAYHEDWKNLQNEMSKVPFSKLSLNLCMNFFINIDLNDPIHQQVNSYLQALYGLGSFGTRSFAKAAKSFLNVLPDLKNFSNFNEVFFFFWLFLVAS